MMDVMGAHARLWCHRALYAFFRVMFCRSLNAIKAVAIAAIPTLKNLHEFYHCFALKKHRIDHAILKLFFATSILSNIDTPTI